MKITYHPNHGGCLIQITRYEGWNTFCPPIKMVFNVYHIFVNTNFFLIMLSIDYITWMTQYFYTSYTSQIKNTSFFHHKYHYISLIVYCTGRKTNKKNIPITILKVDPLNFLFGSYSTLLT